MWVKHFVFPPEWVFHKQKNCQNTSFWQKYAIFLLKHYVSALFVSFPIQTVKCAENPHFGQSVYFSTEIMCFSTFLFGCKISKSKWLNVPKALVSVKFVYFSAEIMCFGTFLLGCKISMSKQLNVPKILILVKFVYFCAKIMCFSTFQSFITLFSLLQMPMCIVMPSEQKTRTGRKTSGFFQIILAYNGSTPYIPCLLETHRDLQQSLTNIECCIQDVVCDVNYVRALLSDGELKDFFSDM